MAETTIKALEVTMASQSRYIKSKGIWSKLGITPISPKEFLDMLKR